MGVLTDFKARGVEDILITVTDNLEWIYRNYQECVSNIYHSNMRSASNKKLLSVCGLERKKEFTSDLKNIYNAPTKEAAKMELENFVENGD